MAWLEWRNGIAYLGWWEGGRQRRRSLKTRDQRLADAHLRHHEALHGKRHDGEAVSPDRTPLEVMDDFLAHLEASVRPATVRFYREKLSPLCTAWDGTPLSLWSPVALSRYIAEKRKDRRQIDPESKDVPWTPRTVRAFVGACRRFEAWCTAMGVPCAAFSEKVAMPKSRQAEPETLSPEQVSAILSTAKAKRHRLEVPLALACYAGLPWGDLRRLTWAEVDLDGGWIRRQREKTGVPIVVPICEPLAEVLKRHRAVSGPVCRSMPRNPSNARRSLATLLERAGIPKASRGNGGWHRFRHTFASRLARSGADMGTLQRALGHRHGSPVTLRYLHADEDALRAAAERAFGGGSG